ncbi:hypothetical protein B0H13DRAFT_1866167 [Mycena leptocephala]|nr:hypothetical protein B0H13DRAFT_1866167 [Mycena leptocephala]
MADHCERHSTGGVEELEEMRALPAKQKVPHPLSREDKAGAGKSSLINRVFDVNDAKVSDSKPGEAEIALEITSQTNKLFVRLGIPTPEHINISGTRALQLHRNTSVNNDGMLQEVNNENTSKHKYTHDTQEPTLGNLAQAVSPPARKEFRYFVQHRPDAGMWSSQLAMKVELVASRCLGHGDTPRGQRTHLMHPCANSREPIITFASPSCAPPSAARAAATSGYFPAPLSRCVMAEDKSNAAVHEACEDGGECRPGVCSRWQASKRLEEHGAWGRELVPRKEKGWYSTMGDILNAAVIREPQRGTPRLLCKDNERDECPIGEAIPGTEACGKERKGMDDGLTWKLIGKTRARRTCIKQLQIVAALVRQNCPLSRKISHQSDLVATAKSLIFGRERTTRFPIVATNTGYLQATSRRRRRTLDFVITSLMQSPRSPASSAVMFASRYVAWLQCVSSVDGRPPSFEVSQALAFSMLKTYIKTGTPLKFSSFKGRETRKSGLKIMLPQNLKPYLKIQDSQSKTMPPQGFKTYLQISRTDTRKSRQITSRLNSPQALRSQDGHDFKLVLKAQVLKIATSHEVDQW